VAVLNSALRPEIPPPASLSHADLIDEHKFCIVGEILHPSSTESAQKLLLNVIIHLVLEARDRQRCEVAQGCSELGMFDEENAGLEYIDPCNRAVRPWSFAFEWSSITGLENWDPRLMLRWSEPTNQQGVSPAGSRTADARV
jgi:hypothetical protein